MAGNIEADVKRIADMAKQIRYGIQAMLPTARDQFLTISMPGRVIDTRYGGEFVPPEHYSASGNNRTRVNEAKLVDSMIPLSPIMLGGTGKSVSRSYLAALDHLIPRTSDLDMEHLEQAENQSRSTGAPKVGSKYNAAMKYLRKPAPIRKEGEETFVDIYIKKQRVFGEAQSELEGILTKNSEAAYSTAGMNANDLALVSSQMRRANDKVQGAWMDWVINGNKTMIDHHFALVDTTTVMSRIEMAKVALRRATISDIEDSTEWARVTLSPADWAQLCKSKAESWKSENPLSNKLMEMEVERLERLILALKGNLAWAKEKSADLKPTKLPGDDVAVDDATGDEVIQIVQRAINAVKGAIEKIKTEENISNEGPMKDPLKKADEAIVNATDSITAASGKSGTDKTTAIRTAASDTMTAAKAIEDGVKGLKDAEKTAATGAITTAVTDATTAAEKAINATNKLNKAANDHVDQKKIDAHKKLTGFTADYNQAEKTTPPKKTEFDRFMSEIAGASAELDPAHMKKPDEAKAITYEQAKHLEKSLQGKIDEFVQVIAQLKGKMRSNIAASHSDLNNTVTGVEMVKREGGEGRLEPTIGEPMVSENIQAGLTEGGGESTKSDPWTTIEFTTSSSVSTEETTESSSEVHVAARIGWSFFNLAASAGHDESAASNAMWKDTKDCALKGSFSALLVEINRPWLHAELFEDHDVNTPSSFKLSPGPGDLKDWLENGNENQLKDYGSFPWYPTAFIVAANTVLEIACSSSIAELHGSSSSRSSQGSAGYGFFASANASEKSSYKSGSSRTEVTDTGIKISFGAPQIIGWVSTVLPELPRKDNHGGLSGKPARYGW